MKRTIAYRRLHALAALLLSAVLCLLALIRALLVSAPPTPIRPKVGDEVRAPARQTVPEARLAGVGDPFQLAQQTRAATDTVAKPAPTAPADPVRLVGIIPLSTGGLAAVESANGSRLMRVGDRWSGLQLREVGAGRAVFADTATGRSIVINMRKTGT